MEVMRPYLFRVATTRIGNIQIPGHYDNTLNMWAVDVGGEPRPLIDGDNDLAELTTKTKVNQEIDDTEFSMLELSTKTATEVERDDELLAGKAALLELTTKTDAQLERDDTDPSVNGFM